MSRCFYVEVESFGKALAVGTRKRRAEQDVALRDWSVSLLEFSCAEILVSPRSKPPRLQLNIGQSSWGKVGYVVNMPSPLQPFPQFLNNSAHCPSRYDLLSIAYQCTLV